MVHPPGATEVPLVPCEGQRSCPATSPPLRRRVWPALCSRPPAALEAQDCRSPTGQVQQIGARRSLQGRQDVQGLPLASRGLPSFPGLPRASTGSQGLPRAPTGLLGPSKGVQGHLVTVQGLPRPSKGVQRLPQAGTFQGFPRTFQDLPWVSNDAQTASRALPETPFFRDRPRVAKRLPSVFKGGSRDLPKHSKGLQPSSMESQGPSNIAQGLPTPRETLQTYPLVSKEFSTLPAAGRLAVPATQPRVSHSGVASLHKSQRVSEEFVFHAFRAERRGYRRPQRVWRIRPDFRRTRTARARSRSAPFQAKDR